MPSYDIEAAVKKYIMKMQPARLTPILRRAKQVADAKVLEAFVDRKKVFLKIRPIMDADVTNLELRAAYLAYSLALDKSQRTMPYMVDRIREHDILRYRWETRGLASGILDKIDATLIYNTTDVV